MTGIIPVRLSCWILAALMVGGCAARQPQPVNRQAALFKEFSDRVKKYVELQKTLESKLPHLNEKADAPAIAAHRQALAAALREARANARPGDIFLPEVQPLFKWIIRTNLGRKAGGNTGESQRAVSKR